MPDDVKKKVDEAKDKIVSGETQVTSAFGLSTDEVSKIISSVAL